MNHQLRVTGYLVLVFGAAASLGCGGSTITATTGEDAGATTGDDAMTASGDAGGADGTSTASDGGAASDTGVAACAPDGGTASTAGVGCTYAYSGFNSSASVNATSTVSWSCSSTSRSVTANGLPDHPVGTFPNSNCPNTISAQSVSATLSLTPAKTSSASRVAPTGYAFNGVKFDPSTAGTCSVSSTGTVSCSLIGASGTWNIEALGQSSFDFGVDTNNAHVQPTGDYHYHGMPEGILDKLGKGKALTLVGWALDGFPMYARYGYTDPTDATSAITTMKGSYQLKSSPDSGRPSTSTYPMGAFTQDYEYVAGSGDLDECNGRFGVTPEFPCGIYHYYITDTYPFIQRCVKGTPSSSGGGMEGPPPGSDAGMGGPPGDAGMMSGGASCTKTSDCSANEVCCPTGQPCANQCVPDCRVSGGSGCPSGRACNTTNGVCE